MAATVIPSAYALRPVANTLAFISTTNVHSTLFPYTWASALHAARISMVFQNNMRKGGNKLSWGTYLVGHLVMCWSGMVYSCVLLGTPPPVLYSAHLYVSYISVHLLMTAIFNATGSLLSNPTLDLFLWPLDGLLRGNAVCAVLASISSPKTNPILANSPFFHLLLGAITSSGGGLTGATLGVWTPLWTFKTPVFLLPGIGFIGTVDAWGGALIALTYGIAAAHPAFAPVVTFFGEKSIPTLSPLGAKALATCVISMLFGWRTFTVRAMAMPAEKEKGKEKMQ